MWCDSVGVKKCSQGKQYKQYTRTYHYNYIHPVWEIFINERVSRREGSKQIGVGQRSFCILEQEFKWLWIGWVLWELFNLDEFLI